MKKQIFVILFTLYTSVTFAQIGYQVSLLNSATGQPRAGETVTVDIKLTNSENATVYTTQQKATSNDFGVLSLSVGDAETFEELDWNKLPLYIEVSIDGVLIAKSQVLSVPVAEYAKKSGFVLTEEFLASKPWVNTEHDIEQGEHYYFITTLTFRVDGTFSIVYSGPYGSSSESGKYLLYNNKRLCVKQKSKVFTANRSFIKQNPRLKQSGTKKPRYHPDCCKYATTLCF